MRGLGVAKRDDRRAARGLAHAAQTPALRQRAVDEALRQQHVPFAHGLDADLLQQRDPGPRGVCRRHGRRPVLEPPCRR